MADSKDSAIKLFGKTIPLRKSEEASCNDDHSAAVSVVDSDAGESCSDRKAFVSSSNNTASALPDENSGEADKETSGKERNSEKGSVTDQIAEDCKEDLESPSAERETSSLKSSKSADQSEISDSQEKTLKKPDKIIPCPRCNSMDTKFCYYNNYNVNQPRHFCKNCQRYWTAGGTMRNVPVGAGRRKNKNSSASHYQHLVMSDALQRAQANAASGIHSPTLGSNGTILTFGSDSPPCESMASALNIVEKPPNSFPNGFHGAEKGVVVPNGGGDNGDNHSSCSSVTAATSSERGGKPVAKDYQGFPQVPCFPGPLWPYPWNSAQWTPPLPSPAFCHSGFPVSFYPAPPYWGSTVPGPWNVQCYSPTSSTTNQSSSSAVPNQSTLGKHSRDGEILNSPSSQKGSPAKENNNSSERRVLIPKTLRIDDPTEAAKSSIWATLGIKNEKLGPSSGGGLYKAFQSKGDEKNRVVEMSPVLQANPAALSRSLRFLEST